MDNGYGGKSIGYGRDRISDFPMSNPSGRRMRIPMDADLGFGLCVLFMSAVVIFAVYIFHTNPLFWVIAFVMFCQWIIGLDESIKNREELKELGFDVDD